MLSNKNLKYVYFFSLIIFKNVYKMALILLKIIMSKCVSQFRKNVFVYVEPILSLFFLI